MGVGNMVMLDTSQYKCETTQLPYCRRRWSSTQSMSHPSAVLLVQADDGARAGLAAGLRRDGMKVVEFAVAEQAKDAASEITIIMTPEPAVGRLDAPQGSHCLIKPFEAAKLSQFIRLVAAKAEAPETPIRAV